MTNCLNMYVSQLSTFFSLLFLFFSSFFSSLAKLQNLDLGFWSSSDGEPYSSTAPLSSMRIWSLLIMVLSLWAIVSTVAPLNSSVINFWMVSSVTTSIFAVASSRITILLFFKMALIMHRSYLSPTARLPPFSVILKLRPAALDLSGVSSGVVLAGLVSLFLSSFSSSSSTCSFLRR